MKTLRLLVIIGISLILCSNLAFAIEAPTVKSFDYCLTLDFDEDGALDDTEIVWEPVPGANHYYIVPSYVGYGFGLPYDRFIIPAHDIKELPNGDLKAVWPDFQKNHPQPVAYTIDAVALIAVDSSGDLSNHSDLAYIGSHDTLIYGKITNEETGMPLEGAKVHYIQHEIHHDTWFNEGTTYTDEDGRYYILGLSDKYAGSGAPHETHIDIYKPGHIRSNGNKIILREEGKIVNRDFVLKGRSSLPQMLYMYNVNNFVIYYRGYDKENGYRLIYSYRFDDGEWSAWSGRIYLPLYHVIIRQGITKGLHKVQVKARDRHGLESPPESMYIFVR